MTEKENTVLGLTKEKQQELLEWLKSDEGKEECRRIDEEDKKRDVELFARRNYFDPNDRKDIYGVAA